MSPPSGPQALHFRSGLTLPPRLEVPVHRRGLHVGGKLRQGAGEFFSADDGEGEGGGAGAHGDVSVGGAVGGGRGGRGAGAHGHVAVLSAVRGRRAQRGEAARLQGTAGAQRKGSINAQAAHAPPSRELLGTGNTPELSPGLL